MFDSNNENDELLDQFISELISALDTGCTKYEFIDLIQEAFHNGIFNNQIQKFIYQNYSSHEEEYLIREGLTEELINEIKEKIREEHEEYYEELKTECEEEFIENMHNNFKSILTGNDDNNEYLWIFNSAVDELKKIIVSKKEFMSIIIRKIKDDILKQINENNINNEYKEFIKIIENKLILDLKKDKKYMNNLRNKLIEEITQNIFDE